MSVKIMGLVWELDLPQRDLLVLLALADHADHEGANAYPSLALIAWKVGSSERTVQRSVTRLVERGILEAQSRPGKTTVFNLHLDRCPSKPPFRSSNPRQNVTPDKMSPLTRQPKICGGTPDTAVSPEPSIENRQEESTRAPELPDHAPVAARIEDKPAPQPDGGAKAYAIVEAYCDGWNIVIERYRKNLHITHLKAARQLAELGASPDEVKAMIAEKRAAGKQMDEYPLVFAARDYVAWKAKQDKFAPVVVDEKTAWRAAQKARPNVKYDAGMDMVLPAFNDEDDRRRYITEYLNLAYIPLLKEAAS